MKNVGLRFATSNVPTVTAIAPSKNTCAIALTPNNKKRALFKSEAGTVGYICRERCFENNLIMRHVGDRMIISPPLIITKAEVDILIQRANRALDEAMEKIIQEGLMC